MTEADDRRVFLRAHWAALDVLLDELLTASQDVMSEAEKGEVQHYIDHNEQGLALKTFVAIYAEGSKVATPVVVELVERLAVKMKLDSKPLLEELLRYS